MSTPSKKSVRTWAGLFLFLLLIVTAIAATFLPRLRSEYSMRQFLPDGSPLLAIDREIQTEYDLGEDEPLIVLLSRSSGSWLAPEGMVALSRATDSILARPEARHVLSLANVEAAVESGSTLAVGKLGTLVPPAERRARFGGDPLLTPTLVSRDERTAVIVVDTGDLEAAKLGAFNHSLRDELPRLVPGTQVTLGGAPAIQSDMNELLREELSRFILWAAIACIVAVLAFFRGFVPALCCTFVIVLANIWAFAYLAISGTPFTLLSNTLPVLVSITALAMSTHTLMILAEESRAFPGQKTQAVRRTLKRLLLPNFLMALTTSVGFAMLGDSTVPVIRHYGWSICWAEAIVWVGSTLALPPLMLLLPLPVPRSWCRTRASWVMGLLQNRRRIVYGTLGALLLGVCFSRGLNHSVRLFDDLPSEREARRSTELIDAAVGGTVPLEIEVRIPSSSDESPWNDPARLSRLRELESRWRKVDGVGSIIALADFVKSPALVPARARRAIAEQAFLYAMSESKPLAHYLSGDGRAVRIGFRMRDLPSDRMQRLAEGILTEFRAAFPGARVRIGGMGALAHPLNRTLSWELIGSLWQSLLLITVLLIVAFRSVRWAVVAAVPNLMAPAVLLLVMAYLKTPIKPGIALIFSIALGIAYNNTVYLIGRLRQLEAKGLPLPVARAWAEEGNPCLYSTISLFAGFAVFLSSEFTLNRTFGGYMLLSLIAGLFGDLVFLPAFLALVPRLFRGPRTLTASTIPVILIPRREHSMLEKLAASVLIVVGLTALPASAGPMTADQILKEVDHRMKAHDESARIVMTIGEAGGATKTREVEIQRKSGGGEKVLVRLDTPADLRGTALLSVDDQGKEDQWLYLPSSKQSRRILGTGKGGSFLDSELSYEDMGSSSERKFSSALLRTEASSQGQVAVIENRLKSGDSAYSRVLIWIPLSSFLVSKIEYYDHSGKLLKVSEMKNYAAFGSGALRTWRAREVFVQNVQNHRTTRLLLKNLAVNRGIEDNVFTVASLNDN